MCVCVFITCACVYEVKHAFSIIIMPLSLSLLCVFPKTEQKRAKKNTRFQDLDFPLSGCFFFFCMLLFPPKKRPKIFIFRRG